jgi:hypothetical protein
MKISLAFAVVFFSLNCMAQIYPLSDFSTSAKSKTWSDTSSTNKLFSVSIFRSRLEISKRVYSTGQEYPIPGGTLLALDMGEFGGGLYYKPKNTLKDFFFVNGKQVRADYSVTNLYINMREDDPSRELVKGLHVLIAGGNTSSVIAYNNNWLFIDNNAIHNIGSLSRLTVKKDSFTISKILDFNATPTAVATYKNKVFITTGKGFYIVEDADKKETVFETLWPELLFNSIAIIDEKNIYVGMVGGYAKIDSTTKNIVFYVYNK